MKSNDVLQALVVNDSLYLCELEWCFSSFSDLLFPSELEWCFSYHWSLFPVYSNDALVTTDGLKWYFASFSNHWFLISRWSWMMFPSFNRNWSFISQWTQMICPRFSDHWSLIFRWTRMIFVSFCDHWFLVSQRNQMIFPRFSDHWSHISRWTRMMFCTPRGPLISYFRWTRMIVCKLLWPLVHYIPLNSNDVLYAMGTSDLLISGELEILLASFCDNWSNIYQWTRIFFCKL